MAAIIVFLVAFCWWDHHQYNGRYLNASMSLMAQVRHHVLP
jgi:hypothetical protein